MILDCINDNITHLIKLDIELNSKLDQIKESLKYNGELERLESIFSDKHCDYPYATQILVYLLLKGIKSTEINSVSDLRRYYHDVQFRII